MTSLQCFQPTSDFFFLLHSHVFPYLLSSFGDWSQPQYCPSGVLTSFQIRVEPHQGLFGDDTAINNIKFRCSSNPTLEGAGMDWGAYGHWSQECLSGGICGIETKMEEYQYGLDDSSLNDVRFHCCVKPQQVRQTYEVQIVFITLTLLTYPNRRCQRKKIQPFVLSQEERYGYRQWWKKYFPPELPLGKLNELWRNQKVANKMVDLQWAILTPHASNIRQQTMGLYPKKCTRLFISHPLEVSPMTKYILTFVFKPEFVIVLFESNLCYFILVQVRENELQG